MQRSVTNRAAPPHGTMVAGAAECSYRRARGSGSGGGGRGARKTTARSSSGPCRRQFSLHGVGHLPAVHSPERARRADCPPRICCVSTASLAHSPSPTSIAGSRARPRRNRMVPTRYCPARVGKHAGPLRLAVQDAALSRRKQGFDSPRGHQAASRPPGNVVSRHSNRRSMHPRAAVPVGTVGGRDGPRHGGEQREPRDRGSGRPEPSGGCRAQLRQGSSDRTSEPGKCIGEGLASQVVGTGHCLLDVGRRWDAG